MTENEAIKEIQRLCCKEPQFSKKSERNCKDNCMYGDNFCAFQMAIKALEKIQEYRKLGTVEEVRKAIEKSTPKKIIKKKDVIYYRSRLGEEKYLYKVFCPNCGNGDLKRGFPCKCGQKLDWEE